MKQMDRTKQSTSALADGSIEIAFIVSVSDLVQLGTSVPLASFLPTGKRSVAVKRGRQSQDGTFTSRACHVAWCRTALTANNINA